MGAGRLRAAVHLLIIPPLVQQQLLHWPPLSLTLPLSKSCKRNAFLRIQRYSLLFKVHRWQPYHLQPTYVISKVLPNWCFLPASWLSAAATLNDLQSPKHSKYTPLCICSCHSLLPRTPCQPFF